MASIRDMILGQKAATKTISIPGWPQPIRIQEMTVGRKLAFFQLLHENVKAVNDFRNGTGPEVREIDETMLGFIFSVVEENDELAFRPEDIHQLDGLPYHVIQAVYQEALHLGRVASLFEEVDAEKKD